MRQLGFLILYTMDITVRPSKRRRTRRDVPLTEGDPEAAEAVTNQEAESSTRKGRTVFVPLHRHHEAELEDVPALPTDTYDYECDQDLGGVGIGDDDPTDAEKTNIVGCLNDIATLIWYLR